MAAAVGLVAALGVGGASTAAADQDRAAHVGVLARYQGGTINLAEGWEDARICHQRENGQVHCYGSEAAYRAGEDLPPARSGDGTLAGEDYPQNYVCLWDGAGYTGPRLQLPAVGGAHVLSDYGFEDRATGVVNRSGMFAQIVDDGYDDFPSLGVPPGPGFPDLSRQAHPHGGSWDNRADLVRTG
ncbi:peptidase inhibitor family I36 protein [Streptomyces sp. URMC 129]|uniref:peptidase inhibitor family I36 protein n=1 Tax=Streptomyces sp. URMC 129 TaxID=3423407 RepID=UPI003F1AC391